MYPAYNAKLIEKKWQDLWQKDSVFSAVTTGDKKNFYVLEMFPYPSGTLHMGHTRNYSIGDVMARYYWANGYNVLHPMGWDACGLPAENAALNNKVHPRQWTYANAHTMKKQAMSLGFSHDWSRELFSCDPSYFRHEQKMFLDFHAKGFAYRKKSYVNWDPVDMSVLANEQVVDGKGWRSGAVVEKKLLKQWFLRITDFAQELLDDLGRLTGWPESVRQMQVNWIGKSDGALINFDVVDSSSTLTVFTTRPETIFGATFCAVAWDHPLVAQSGVAGLDDFVQECRQGAVSHDQDDTMDKKGIDLGLKAVHPFLPDVLLPIYCVNYVRSDYGSGAVFACPSHDQRDFDFAQAYDIDKKPVIQPVQGLHDFDHSAYTGDGHMVQSGPLNGLTVADAKERIIQLLESNDKGKRTTSFRLRDWGIGRQRYWGVPIPIIYCPDCGTVPVPSQDLPVTLPDDVSFDTPGNPLDHHPTWKHVNCPVCKGKAQRETDTFDTFFESSWYFARFCDPKNDTHAFDAAITDRWLPVDQYIGGIEHAVMHLLYARFFTKMLKKCGYWDVSEPFKGLFTQGMVCHKTFRAQNGAWLFPSEVTKDGTSIHDGAPVIIGRSEKMSKSKCNVVGVTEMVDTYGADAVRLFVLSDTPPAKDFEWTETGIEGAWRYVKKVWTLVNDKHALCHDVSWPSTAPASCSARGLALRQLTHRAISKINTHIQGYVLNKYIADLREWGNSIASFVPETCCDQWCLKEALVFFVQAMAPAMPHIAEELKEMMGLHGYVHTLAWPQADAQLAQNTGTTLSVQINGKHRGVLNVDPDIDQETVCDLIRQNPTWNARLQGKWKRIIFIPNKMINIVVEAVD